MIADVRAPLWALVRDLDRRREEALRAARLLRATGKHNSYEHGEVMGRSETYKTVASQLADVVLHLND